MKRTESQPCITASDPLKRLRALAFAREHDFEFQQTITETLGLDFGPSGLSLSAGVLKLQIDFLHGEYAHRKQFGGGRGQPLARAVGIKPGRPLPAIVDATAGLGRDAYVLANLGCAIRMFEKSPIVAALLADAIERAANEPVFAQLIEQGFQLIQGDSVHYLRNLRDRPDAVYLDPMYPGRSKSAAVKKNMRLLQDLLGHDDDEAGLLDAARCCATKRVAVKRPKTAGWLAEQKPDASIQGPNTRYDLYMS